MKHSHSVPIFQNFFKNIYRKNVLILLVLILAGISVSCSTYRTFTTYFNVVYLAQQHLDLYEDGLQKEQTAQSGAAAVVTTHRWLDEEYFARQLYKKRTGLAMPVGPVNKNVVAANRTVSSLHLDSAIILGSKVLADKKETKFIEDALFIVGKAQFYKNDFAGAKRKFNELLAHFPNTKYGTEVGMLLARSMMAANEFDTAATAVGKVLANAEHSGSSNEISEAHKAYAELILASSPDSLSLAAEHLRLAEAGQSADVSSRLSFERGILYFLDGKWSDAENAFNHTIDKTPDPSLQGEAIVALGESQRRQKKFSEARQNFQNTLQKSRYANSHPSAQYEYAYTVDLEARQSERDDLKSSSYKLKYYPDVKSAYNTVDTLYRNISQAIMARSRFRQAEIFRSMGEYDSAAHVANLILGTKDFSTQEMNDYVNERIRALARFAEWKLQLTKIDTIEHLLHKMRRPNSTMAETVTKEIRVEAEQKVLGSRWTPEKKVVLTPEEEKLVSQYEERIRKEKATGTINVFNINFNDTTKYIDSIHSIASHAHFELGRAYENFTEYLSAIAEYQQALSYSFMKPDTAVNVFRAQVIFTWVELDHQLGNVLQRDSLIEILTKNYGETMFAQQASKEYAGLRDKDSPGEVAYRTAYSLLKSSGIDNAKPQFLSLITEHKHEDVAARALYTIGVSYEDKSRFDSAVVYYRRVINEYPYSKYAEYLKPKMLYALRETPKPAPHIQSNIIGQTPPLNQTKTLQDTIKTNGSPIKNTPQINVQTVPHK
jgi:TolA-binding protein